MSANPIPRRSVPYLKIPQLNSVTLRPDGQLFNHFLSTVFHKSWAVMNCINKYILINPKSTFYRILVRSKAVPVLFLTEHHAMKAYWGSGCLVLRILDLGTRWRWVFSFTPQPFYPQGKSPKAQSQSGRGDEKNSQSLPEFEPPIIQSTSQRYTTELSRLLLCFGWNSLM
jgi:hypothetical protein